MLYDLIIPLAGAFIIILLILLKMRGKGRTQNARRTTHSGLVLERSPKEKKGGKKSSLAGPLFIALALAIIGGWLAISYLNPGRNADAGATPEAAEGPQEDVRVMSGRIVRNEDSTQGAAPMAEAAQRAGAAGSAAAQAAPTPPLPPGAGSGGQAQAPPPPQEPLTLAQAAQGILPTVSRMEQVGLLPARTGLAQTNNVPARTGQEQANNAPANAGPERQAQKPPAQPPRAREAASPAAQDSAPKPAAAAPRQRPAAAPPAAAPEGRILGGVREFTVHLASFADRANAEKYMGKLVSARVNDAFVAESVVNGRLWYRVMSGRFASQAEAEAHGNDLRRRNLTASGGRYVIKSIP